MKLMTVNIVVLMTLLLTACSTEPLTAPCDEYGTFCGAKTKINQW